MKTITITKKEIKNTTDAVKWHLKNYGHITPLEALKKYGNLRLASIIKNLRDQGYDIHTTYIERKTKFGVKNKFAKYLYFKPKPQCYISL